MEVYIYLYRYTPHYVFNIHTLKHMNISVIISLEFAIQHKRRAEMRVKITYQSNQL